MIWWSAIFCCVALLVPGRVIAARDSDWPCPQIKVPELSLASVWSGPSVDQNDASWKDDRPIAQLVQMIAARREPMDKAAQLIRNHATSAGERKQTQLSRVLIGVFSVLSQERESILAGLSRFSVRQKELAVEIRSDNEKLRTARSSAAADPDAIQHLTRKVTWELEVFQDRSQALKYACEVPSKIEQRLFNLARQIQSQME